MTSSETGTAAPPPAAATDLIPFRTAVRAWFAISWQTFGGPAGQIEEVHDAARLWSSSSSSSSMISP